MYVLSKDNLKCSTAIEPNVLPYKQGCLGKTFRLKECDISVYGRFLTRR